MSKTLDSRPDYELARERVNALAHSLGLDMRAVFVPFSQSRNAKPRNGQDKPWQSLNWRVTLTRNGRDVLETDYSQGTAHTPAHKAPAATFDKWQRSQAIALEIETGKRAADDACAIYRQRQGEAEDAQRLAEQEAAEALAAREDLKRMLADAEQRLAAAEAENAQLWAEIETLTAPAPALAA